MPAPSAMPGSGLLSVPLAALLLVAVVSCDLPTSPPRFQPTFVIAAEEIRVPVTSTSASAATSRDLRGFDADMVARARGGALVVDLVNPAAATGTVTVRIEGGGASVQGEVDVAGGNGQRIPVPEATLQTLLGSDARITVSGTLCPASGCAPGPAPFPEVVFRPRIEITFEIGGDD